MQLATSRAAPNCLIKFNCPRIPWADENRSQFSSNIGCTFKWKQDYFFVQFPFSYYNFFWERFKSEQISFVGSLSCKMWKQAFTFLNWKWGLNWNGLLASSYKMQIKYVRVTFFTFEKNFKDYEHKIYDIFTPHEPTMYVCRI